MTTRRTRIRPAPLQSIVVATDFSPSADLALRRAALLPLAPKARVSILHVHPQDIPPRLLQAAGSIMDQRLSRDLGQFGEYARAAGRSDLRITGDLSAGNPFVELIRHARRRKADLIVLGRHGRARVRDLLLGTTAQRVLRKSSIPLLIVNRPGRGPYRRPLLALDFGAASRPVCELAARVIDPRVPAVFVIHAYEVPYAGWLPLNRRLPGIQGQVAYRMEATRALRRFLAGVADLGLPLRPRLRSGEPRSVILGELQRRRSDLIALGTHGRAGIARALLGTVAEIVVAGASCDVLITRPPRLSIRLP